MPVVVASVGGSGGAGRASSRRSLRPGARRRRDGSIEPVSEVRRLVVSAVRCGAAMAAIVGVTLVARRLSGAIPAPRSVIALVAATAAGMTLVALADRVGPRDVATRFVARFGLALAVAALLPPLGSAAIPAGEMIVAIAAILAAVSTLLSVLGPAPERSCAAVSNGRPPAPRRGRRGPPRRRRADEPPATDALSPPAAPDPADGLRPTVLPVSRPVPATFSPATDSAAPSPRPGGWPTIDPGAIVVQRFERIVDPAEQAEILRGTILIRVTAGSRSAIGHVAFCPPFPRLPKVEVGTGSEEVEATVLAAEVLPWGVRVECRLDEAADESIDVPVDVVARSSTAPEPAPPACP